MIIPNKSAEDRELLNPLVQELWGMGRERHDDTVMALWIAEVVLRKAAFVHRLAIGDEILEGEAEERTAGADLLDDHLDAEPVRTREGLTDLDENPAWRGLLDRF